MYSPAPRLRPHERAIALHRATAKLLAKPIRGKGGFQSLLRRLQDGLDFAPPGTPTVPNGLAGGDVLHGDLLFVDVRDIQLLIRMASGGGARRGGFQRRVAALLADWFFNEQAYPEPPTGQIALPFDAPRRPQTPLRVIRGGRS
jgi:hypothetical protein